MEKKYKIISIILIIAMVAVVIGYREYQVDHLDRHPNPPPPNFYNTSGLKLIYSNYFNSGESGYINFTMPANNTRLSIEEWNNGTGQVDAKIINPKGALYENCAMYKGQGLINYYSKGYETGVWTIEMSSAVTFNITVQIYIKA
ncbi:MAG: hypothetical protein ACYDCP_03450 [Thermoplasmataceae archaeon]